MSRTHPEQWVIRRDIDRAAPDIVAQFRTYSTTQIADCGGAVAVLGPGVLPQSSHTDMCGSAVTLWTKPGDILFILKAPDLIEEGDVLVIDGGGRMDAAVIGDIFSALVRDRGGVGIVVDGAVRDAESFEALEIPIFARGVHPATASKEGPGALNVTVQCAGVVIRPGDIIRADKNGVVVIPQQSAPSVLSMVEQVAVREEQWRTAFQHGKSPGETLGVDALIAELAGTPDSDPLP